MESASFKRSDHIQYFISTLMKGLPEPYVMLDTSRLTAVYFAVMGLDVLGALDQIDKQRVIDYILAMQIPADKTGCNPGHCGFIGSSFLGQPFGCYECIQSSEYCGQVSSSPMQTPASIRYTQGHLAMTYTALAVLLTLDKSIFQSGTLDKASIIDGLKHLQQPDGSFRATYDGGECDMRFLYCACAISAMLGDWSGVNVDLAASFVRSCVTYEGGIALVPGSEAHGGSCYTGLASLALMGKLDETLRVEGKDALASWCYSRVQDEGGYSGRTNKETDSCYSFWIGATLMLLGAFNDSEHTQTLQFLLNRCQAQKPGRGGFRKTPDSYEDIVHSFYSLSWLAMSASSEELLLRPLDVRLAICSDRVLERFVDGGKVVFD